MLQVGHAGSVLTAAGSAEARAYTSTELTDRGADLPLVGEPGGLRDVIEKLDLGLSDGSDLPGTPSLGDLGLDGTVDAGMVRAEVSPDGGGPRRRFRTFGAVPPLGQQSDVDAAGAPIAVDAGRSPRAW